MADTLNAATMLGQSKTAYQAEIDAACELIDFWRYNVHFAAQLLAEQPPANSKGMWNRTDHRPLEGFVYAITPFNFTAIAGNLPTAPALMGNTVVWKPSPTQAFAAHFTMRLLEAAGLPPGVINLVHGDGLAVSEVALAHPDLAGIHFTGSTPTFKNLWRTVAANLDTYRGYPRIVGETGGKDFVLAHAPRTSTSCARRSSGAPSSTRARNAPPPRAPTSRARCGRVQDDLVDIVESLPMGAGHRLPQLPRRGHRRAGVRQARRGDRARPELDSDRDHRGRKLRRLRRLVRAADRRARRGPDRRDVHHRVLRPDPRGPRLRRRPIRRRRHAARLGVSQYALTGSIIAQDRTAIADAMERLRFAAGNFYVNDKPTGAVVGQQPFGGARASGTNDKAGAAQNLQRWTSTRSIKETFVPPTSHAYPHMG